MGLNSDRLIDIVLCIDKKKHIYLCTFINKKNFFDWALNLKGMSFVESVYNRY